MRSLKNQFYEDSHIYTFLGMMSSLTALESDKALNDFGSPTDYGCPMKPFFIKIHKLLGLGRQIGQINFGVFRVFSAKLKVSKSHN